MRVLVINKYVPPEPAPTAVLAGDLACMLRARGAEVSFLGAELGYRGGKPQGWRRWVREIKLLLRLFWKGITFARPDCILCLSDPPGVLVIATILAQLKRAKLVHWAMDVYPDTAVALGEVRPGSLVHKITSVAMSFAYARCSLIACLDSDMLQHLGLQGDNRAFLSAPWPAQKVSILEAPLLPHPHPGRIRWLYSGNLGRAHEYETLLLTQKQLEDEGLPFDLVFQGGGNAWSAAKALATDLGLQHCQWEDYASEKDFVPSLLRAHVLIATQRHEVKGLLWPSKLALLKLLPRSIVWVGPQDGSIAQDLRNAHQSNGVFAVGDAQGLAAWLRSQSAQFAEAASKPFPSLSLEAACTNAAQREGEKWWSHLAALVMPSARNATPLGAPASGNPA